jgi:hypothetical protein
VPAAQSSRHAQGSLIIRVSQDQEFHDEIVF